MNIKVVVPAVAGLLVVGGLAAPYAVGMNIEPHFHEELASVGETTGLAIEVSDYERGWFTSHARVTARTGSTAIRTEYDIQHGPFPGFNWATIEGRTDDITLADDAWREIDALFDGPPLTVTANVPLFGDTRLDFFSPQTRGRIDNDRTEVQWQGLEGTIMTDGDRSEGRLTAPGLALTERAATVRIEGVSLEGDGRVFDRNSVLRSIGDQEIDLTIDRFEARDGSQGEEIAFTANLHSKVSPSDDGKTLDSATTVQLTDVALHLIGTPAEHLVMDEGAIEYRLEGIRTTALFALHDKVRAIQAKAMSPAERERAFDQAFATSMDAFMAGTPSMTLAIPQFTTENGAMQARVTMGLGELEESERVARAPAIARVMDRMALNWDLDIDLSLLREWAGAAPNSDEVLAVMQGMVDQGFAEIGDGTLGTEGHATNHEIVLNGTALPDAQRRALMMQVMAGMLGAG